MEEVKANKFGKTTSVYIALGILQEYIRKFTVEKMGEDSGREHIA
jgi:hypothetical protein